MQSHTFYLVTCVYKYPLGKKGYWLVIKLDRCLTSLRNVILGAGQGYVSQNIIDTVHCQECTTLLIMGNVGSFLVNQGAIRLKQYKQIPPVMSVLNSRCNYVFDLLARLLKLSYIKPSKCQVSINITNIWLKQVFINM